MQKSETVSLANPYTFTLSVVEFVHIPLLSPCLWLNSYRGLPGQLTSCCHPWLLWDHSPHAGLHHMGPWVGSLRKVVADTPPPRFTQGHHVHDFPQFTQIRLSGLPTVHTDTAFMALILKIHSVSYIAVTSTLKFTKLYGFHNLSSNFTQLYNFHKFYPQNWLSYMASTTSTCTVHSVIQLPRLLPWNFNQLYGFNDLYPQSSLTHMVSMTCTLKVHSATRLQWLVPSKFTQLYGLNDLYPQSSLSYTV